MGRLLNQTPSNISVSPQFISTIAGHGKDNITQQIKQELNDKFDFDYSPTFP